MGEREMRNKEERDVLEEEMMRKIESDVLLLRLFLWMLPACEGADRSIVRRRQLEMALCDGFGPDS